MNQMTQDDDQAEGGSDLEQLLLELSRDRQAIRRLPLDPVLVQQLDLTVMSYLEEIIKHLLDVENTVDDLVDEVGGDDDEQAGGLDAEFVAQIIQLAGVAEGLAMAQSKLAQLIHGASTLQEVKSAVGKLDETVAALAQVTALAQEVLVGLAARTDQQPMLVEDGAPTGDDTGATEQQQVEATSGDV
jgi:hypothetical protein